MLLEKTDLEKLKETLDAIGKKYETKCDLDHKDQVIMVLPSGTYNTVTNWERIPPIFCLAMSFNKGKFIKSWVDTYRSIYCIFFEFDLTKYFGDVEVEDAKK